MTKEIKKVVSILKRKFRISLYTYAILALILFTLSASIIFFNLFAVRMNPAKLASDPKQVEQLQTEQIIFIVITVLTAFVTFLGGIGALFNFESKNKTLKDKVLQIKLEVENFKLKKDKYQDAQNEELLINSVSEIIENFEGN